MTIPDAWADAVGEALREAFGVEAPEQAQLLAGGMSGAQVLRIVVAGTPYVLRLDPPGVGFGDPSRWHGCMRIAAAAGVAPPVRYAGASGVSIVDFVAARPGGGSPADREARLVGLGGMIRRLHEAPAFPPMFDRLDGLNWLIGNARATGVITDEELEQPMQRYARLAEACLALPPQLVSSHNDLHPRNIVHDGERLWFVDWQAASFADRYTDLASIASFFARDERTEAVFLEAYFGGPPRPDQQARFYLTRQINHLFYAMALLPTTGGARPRQSRPLEALHLALAAGEPVMETAHGRAEYAHARLAAMMSGVDSPRFQEARRLAV